MMAADSARVAIMTAKYQELIGGFVDGTIAAPEFQRSYLDLFKHDASQVPGGEFDVLDGLFADVDDYTPDPALRSQAGGLDDDQLRSCARDAYRKLYQT